MKSLTKKIRWLITRHPLLYYVRFLLLSRTDRKTPMDSLDSFSDCNSLKDIAPLFFEVNDKMQIDPSLPDFEKAKIIGTYLRLHTPIGPGVSRSSEATLKEMLHGRGGICSDFALVFNVFCLLHGIRSREWNCVDKLYRAEYGHAFNEIYDKGLQKWIAIDIHKNIYFSWPENPVALSVEELFTGLRQGKPLHYECFSSYKPHNAHRLPGVYSHKTIPFLVSNYRLSVIDPVLDKLQKTPMALITIWLVITRGSHRFIFPMDSHKDKLRER